MTTASPPLEPRRSKLATLGAGLGLIVAFYLLWLFWARTQAWTEAGALPFFAAMAALPAIGVPISPFFLAAAAFGIHLGVIGSLAAVGANLALCYWIAHSGLKSGIEWLMQRLGYTLPAIDTNASGIRFTLLVKLTPGLPTFAKNYLLCIAGVPFVPYFVLSMIISGTYGIVLLLLGESVLRHNIGRGLALASVIVVVPIGLWLWRRRRRGRSFSGPS